jgi:S-phase kinase-associated protein 1
MLTLVSSDGDAFEVSQAVLNMCGWATTAQEVADSSGDLELTVPITNTHVLRHVVEFCNHHIEEPMNEIEKPLVSANMREVVPIWYADFVTIEQELLFELILAANYMDIKPLLDLTCATVASMIKGKTPEEIRLTFNIVNDFTPEEEAQVREENRWLEEA